MRPSTLHLLCSCFAAIGFTACSDGGDDGPPDVDKPFAESELLEACTRASACGIQTARVADCVDDYHNRFLALGQGALWAAAYRCVNKGSGDCKAIRECLGYAGARPTSCQAGYKARCEGSVAYNCDLLSGWEQAIDCASGGLKCGVNESAQAAKCGGGPCDPATYENECRGTQLFACVGGAIEIDDCSAKQLQCRDGRCEGKGRSCPAYLDPKCQQQSVVDCINNYEATIACTALFGRKTCRGGACVGAGNECDVSADFDACEGDVLVACLDGFEQRIDCKQLGFLGCEPKQYGAICKAAPVY